MEAFEDHMLTANNQYKQRTTVPFIAALIIPVLLAACSAAPKIEERSTVSPVAPIAMPAYNLGTVFKQISVPDGSMADWEVIEVPESGGYVGLNFEGCSWTKGRDPISPVLAWDNCGNGEWASGTRTITSTSGSLWPLAPGNRATWTHRFASGEGTPGTGTRSCDVTGPFAISTAAGDVDALKISCEDPWGTVISYWTAEQGEVRTYSVHNERGLEYDHELVAVERL